MDIRRRFGANLRNIRTRVGFTQARLAAEVGVDRAHISAMERGQQNVTLLTLWHVSVALGVTPDELIR
jgi:transcriptional regulator with XRE-family HTH domain